MDAETPARDVVTAHDMKPPATNAALTDVRRGTPMGEWLRRY